MIKKLRHLCQRLVLALNEAAADAKEEVARLLCNEAISASDEWVKLFEYGHYPNKLGMQNCTREGLALMVNEFNTRKTKAGKNWRGDPVTMGHRDLPNKHLPHSGKKVGRVMGWELRDDGPYVQLAWNSLGQENIAEGWAEFPSPEWYVKTDAKGRAQPVRFKGIGMVETPNIPTSTALTNEATPEDSTPNEPKPMTLLETLRAFLALNEDATEADAAIALNEYMIGTPERKPLTLREMLWLEPDATVDQVKAAIGTREAEMKQRKAEIEALKEKLAAEEGKAMAANEKVATLEGQIIALNEENTKAVTALNERLVTANESRRDLLINEAVKSGKASAADREGLIAAFNESFDHGLETISALKPRYDVTGVAINGREARERTLTVNEARERLAGIATARARDNHIPYNQAFNAVWADPAHAALRLACNG